MYNACHEYFDRVDAAVAAAAVADYRPKFVASQKIKKNDSEFFLELEKTKDILFSLGEIKKQQFLNWFCFRN